MYSKKFLVGATSHLKKKLDVLHYLGKEETVQWVSDKVQVMT